MILKKFIFYVFCIISFQLYSFELSSNNKKDAKINISNLILMAAGWSFITDLSRSLYASIKNNIQKYFDDRNNTNAFFISSNNNKSIINFTDFIGRKSIIDELKVFTKNFQQKNNYIQNNTIIIETDNFEKYEYLIEELLFIEAFAHYMNLEFVEINTLVIKNHNAYQFLNSLKKLLNKKNLFFFIDMDKILTNPDNEFSLDIFFEIITVFNKFKNSVLCVKIPKNSKIDGAIKDTILGLFSKNISYYNMKIEDISECIEYVFQLKKIKLDDDISVEDISKLLKHYSYYDLKDFLKNLLDHNKNNVLTQKILLSELNKFADILKSKDQQKEEIKKQSSSIQNYNPEYTENKKFYFQYIQDCNFDNIVGYDTIKKELSKIIKNIGKNSIKKLPGILLYGPPGNGKTKLIKAFAGEAKIPILMVNSGDLIGKYLGETEKNIQSIFKLAKNNAPAIIFIDEIDNLLSKRDINESEKKFVAEFLIELDGINALNGVLFIGATNHLNAIDPSILRSGRINKKIFIDYPDVCDREKIIMYYLKKNNLKFNANICIADIAMQLDGFSGADIESFFYYIQDILDEENNKNKSNNSIIDQNILNIAYKKFKEENRLDDFKFTVIKGQSLDSIAGYKSIKEEIQDVICELKKQNTKKTKIEGLILTGPPGVGKTHFARALASESELPLLVLTPSDLIGKYIGSSEEKLIQLFENIRKNAPCIVFLDEMESLFKHRDINNSDNQYSSNLYTNIINTFLQNMDGIEALKGVLFVGATNFFEQIDKALIRPGRMSKKIIISFPQYQDRIEIIKYFLNKYHLTLEDSIIIENLSERTNGMTPAEIEKFIDTIRILAKKENKSIIDNYLIAEAFQQIVLGKKNTTIIMGEDTIKQTAYHEACHGIFQYILFKNNIGFIKFDFLTIEPRQNTLGVAYGRVPAEYLPATKERYLGYIATLLAGKAGQEIFFNATDSGASSDLEKATDIALEMVTRYGMGTKLRVFNSLKEVENNQEINNEVEKILQEQYKKVLYFLTEYKNLIVDIVNALFKKHILYEAEMYDIVNNYEKKTGKKVIYHT